MKVKEKPLLYPSRVRKEAEKWLKRQGYAYPNIYKVSLEGEWTVEAEVLEGKRILVLKFDSRGNLLMLDEKKKATKK